jgi:hypothetical protein
METPSDTPTTADYPPPVDQLLTIGEPASVPAQDWPSFRQLGIGSEHIPALIRMATDTALHQADAGSAEVWAPTHAWRALGQLRAAAASEPLLALFEALEDDDWAMEELPDVYGLIGPAAIPALAAYLADNSHSEWAHITAISCLEAIGKTHPDARDGCVAALTHHLEGFADNDSSENAFAVLSLTELAAQEAAPLIARAFAAGSVDESIMGDWDDVQAELGLKPRGEELQPPRGPEPLPEPRGDILPPSPTKKRHRHGAVHHKTKQKMAKQSRKKNRRR